MKHIVVLGSTNTDMVVTGRKIPGPGETVTGGRFLMNPGGKGANQAVALARGGRVVQLLAEGMGRYYKPGGGDFEFCSEGRMLLLSPFAPRLANAPRANYGKARFEWLNLAARAIGDLSAGFSRAQLAKR